MSNILDGSVILKPKPNQYSVFHRPLVIMCKTNPLNIITITITIIIKQENNEWRIIKDWLLGHLYKVTKFTRRLWG